MPLRMLWCLVVLAIWGAPRLARADVAPAFTDSPISLLVVGVVLVLVVALPAVLYVRWRRARSASLRDPNAP